MQTEGRARLVVASSVEELGRPTDGPDAGRRTKTVEATKTVKDEFRELIELLPEAAAADALDRVRWMLADGEELTDEELEEVRSVEAEIARGDYLTLEELKRALAR